MHTYTYQWTRCSKRASNELMTRHGKVLDNLLWLQCVHNLVHFGIDLAPKKLTFFGGEEKKIVFDTLHLIKSNKVFFWTQEGKTWWNYLIQSSSFTFHSLISFLVRRSSPHNREKNWLVMSASLTHSVTYLGRLSLFQSSSSSSSWHLSNNNNNFFSFFPRNYGAKAWVRTEGRN